jgi:hypothetical protein
VYCTVLMNWKDLALDSSDIPKLRDLRATRAQKNSQDPHGPMVPTARSRQRGPHSAVLAGGEDQSDAPRTPADQGTQGHHHSQGVRSRYLVWLVWLVWVQPICNESVDPETFPHVSTFLYMSYPSILLSRILIPDNLGELVIPDNQPA